MQLVVAEKPSVARDLARVLGVRPVGTHCFEGDRHVITWCIGHLVEIDEPAAHDPRWRPWRLDTLPILPPELLLRPSRHAVPQLRAVVGLLGERRFTSVVNACDAGREGELIFRLVYRHAGGGPPVRRLWISSLTDDAIRRGFANLAPGARFDPLGDAARCRSEADWLVGMNATRALTTRARFAGHDALYSIGRVQTPTLAMIVRREQQIRSFVPRDYWEIRGDFRTLDGARFSALWRYGVHARLGTVELADTIVARDRVHGSGLDPIGPRVEAVRSRAVREPAPQLFDLTTLQRTANRRFGFSAARTLEIAQALYERHKVLTYPRTDSRHLSSDQVPELPNLFRTLSAIPEYAPFCATLLAAPPKISKRVVDDTKVSDHHAIIPTGKAVRPESLDRDERRLFDLVARRFLGAFFPDAVFAVTEAWIRVGARGPWPPRPAAPAAAAAASPNAEREEPPILETLPPEPDRYLARGRVRVEAGWQLVAGIGAAGTTPDEASPPRPGAELDPDRAILPPLVEGQVLDGSFTPLAKQTRPPPRFTEATLLGAMESAGKAIDDEALRAAMRDCGLGTPATRASTIETLLDRQYIDRERQNLVPTPLGMQLVDTLPVASLASAELTGNWEARLARMARGEETRAAFMADIERYVCEIVDAIRHANLPPPPAGSAPSRPRWGNGSSAGDADLPPPPARGGDARPAPRGPASSARGRSSSARGGDAGRSSPRRDDRATRHAADRAPRRDDTDPRDRRWPDEARDPRDPRWPDEADRGSPARHAPDPCNPRDPRDPRDAMRDEDGPCPGGLRAARSDADPGTPVAAKPARKTPARRRKTAAAGVTAARRATKKGAKGAVEPAATSRDPSPRAPAMGVDDGPAARRTSSHRAAAATSEAAEVSADIGSTARGTSKGAAVGSTTRRASKRAVAAVAAAAAAAVAAAAAAEVAGRVSAKRATAVANDDATIARRPTARRVAAASAATAGSPTSVFGRGPAPSSGESGYRDASEPSGVSRASTAAAGPSGAARRVAPHVAGAVHVDASGLSPSSARPAASRAPTPRAAPRDTAADLAVARELACPRCQSRGLLTGARGWGCARWREGCGFVVWFEIGGRSLRADQLRQLVQHGEVRERFEREGAIHEARWVLDPVAVGGAARIEST